MASAQGRPPDPATSGYASLLSMVEAADLAQPEDVVESLEREHGVTTIPELVEVLEDSEVSKNIPSLWRLRLSKFVKTTREGGASRPTPPPVPSKVSPPRQLPLPDLTGHVLSRWRPSDAGPDVVVVQGDITDCSTDAIVNAANSDLLHCGGVAGAISRKGGSVIQDESASWIRANKQLRVGSAMATSAGRLPCKVVIHTVGPDVGHLPQPTATQTQQLRDAVKSSLALCGRLGLASIALPGISTGIYGYPLDQGAADILDECVQFCREQRTSTIRCVVLMSIDAKTASSFNRALENAARREGGPLRRPIEPAWPSKRDASRHQSRAAIDDDPNAHKAAGVLPMRVSSSGFQVLLGVEYRPLDSPPGQYVNFLGGQRQVGESPEATAGREFVEEVGHLVQTKDIQALLGQKQRSMELWVPFAQYMLYIVLPETQRFDLLPQDYAERKKKGELDLAAEHDCLLWVSWLTVVYAVQSAPSRPVIQTPMGEVPVSSMLTRFVKQFGSVTEHHLELLGADVVVRDERARIERLKRLNDDELVADMTQKDWKLCLTSPPVPPPPPIELLQPHDPDYKATVRHLPQKISSAVVSVRRVRASARIGDYKSETQRLKAQNAAVSEAEPLYHGTPERWRATAIALNGFDLGIHLSGRSHGNGVYTATDPGVAHGYCGETGSILCLRGAVTSGCTNPGENTILPGDPVRVFPNPKCVLPRFIIDLAAADSRDSLEMQRQSVQDESRLGLEKREAMGASIKAQEAAFTRKMANRLRNALGVYAASLDKFSHAVSSTEKSSSQPPGPDKLKAAGAREFFMERQQFARCLPMYEAKPEVIEVLQRNQVAVITADTGSGKSTQLPQLMLDSVLPAGETRRVAVLEPRRVNAISLSRRVAEERGLPPGQEVGYTIGRGESNVTSTTRIEFMTHGLFVQIARDADQLLATYCAVIVDEAHERSVDVDLSLALLKRVLHQLQRKDDDRRLKVVVTSATITSEAQRFREFLDPSTKTSAVLQVQGHMFPVHIEHRPLVKVDPRVVGTAGVNKVLTSAAIQTAMDILRATETGSILVFLASEGSINDALEIARKDLLDSSRVEETSEASLGSLRSSSFSFRLLVGNQEEVASSTGVSARRGEGGTITASIVGFHGKSTRAERDQVLHPPPDRRLVIFSTNVAETGVTLPNIRYVIDAGLERRVRWNAAVDVNEMVTEPVTESSMKQRSGRAGRTASGICIRLFPEPDAEEDQPQSESGGRECEPAMQNAMLCKVVLLDVHMKQHLNEELALLDPMDPSTRSKAEERLHELGALDDNGELTPVGDALLSLGIDLRLGRFLIACSHFGCLVTGTKLVSVLMASDAAERLLPDRRNVDRATLVEEYIDESGDHLTLLHLVEGFDRAQEQGKGLAWCREHEFEVDVFVDAETSREYLLKKLDGLKFNVVDDEEKIQHNGGVESSVRRALCAAYFNHLSRPRADGAPKAGFARILDAVTNQGTLDMMVGFAGKTQPGVGNTGGGDEGFHPHEPVVKAGRHTTLWLDSVASSSASSSKLIVFGSQMLTDGSKNVEPTVQLVSFVTQDEVAAGAADWCRRVDLERLLKSSVRDTLRVPVSAGARTFILAERGRWLKQLQAKFASVFATVGRGEVIVTCPRRIFGRVELHVKKQLQSLEPESVTLQLPSHVNMGKIIGKAGRSAKQLEGSIQALLSSARCGAGHLHVSRRPVVKIHSESREIVLTLEGASKALMSVIVGRIQALIVATHGDATLPLVSKVHGAPSQQEEQFPRLALINSVAPTSWATRDDVMLQLAHALVWKCNASIYGGFLRDWVVRGESAHDIDVRLSPPQVTAASVETTLVQFVANSPEAQRKRVTLMSRGQKGSSFALTFGAHGIAPFDIDLVDPSTIQNRMHPGVDCDAGNLMLNRSQSLCKKVEGAGSSLCTALKNIAKKQFVFYYALESGDAPRNAVALARLKKYLGRKWTCRSAVPASVMGQLSPSERSLIKPAFGST